MIQEIEVKAAEDLTAALNNFNGLTQEVIEENKAALKQELDTVIAQGFDNEKQTVQNLIDTGRAQIATDKQNSLDAINTAVTQAKHNITEQKNNSIDNITAKENASITTLAEKTEGHCTTLNNKIETGENTLQTKITEGTNLLETTKTEKVNELHSTYESDIQGLQDKYNELQAALNNTNATFEQKKAEMLINIFTQTVFVQFPNMPIPDTFLSFEGYRWAEINYGGAFFRASGGVANGFNGGAQAGGIPDAQGWLGFHGNRGGFAGVKGREGNAGNSSVFQERKRVEDSDNGIVTPVNETLINNYKELYLIEATEFRLSYGGMPIANEVRPVNYTVRLWKLEKI